MRIFELATDSVFAYVAHLEFNSARIRLRESLTCARQIGTPHFLAKTLAAAIALWYACGDSELAALWAGMLMHHTHLLHPSLFDNAIYKELETRLGTSRYAQAVEQGASLDLETCLD